MIDINLIREHPELVKKNLKNRQEPEKLKWVDDIKEKDERWRALKKEADELRAERNSVSKQINEAKKEGKDVAKVLAKAKKIPAEIEAKEAEMNRLREEIDSFMLRLPNMLHGS